MKGETMAFAENINRICKEKGTNLTKIYKQLKGSSSFVTSINHKGSIPNQGDLLTLSEMLDCSVMDFFTDEEELAPAQPMDEDEEDILRVYRSLSRRAKHAFMAMVYEYELEGDKEESAVV
jgi:hypothetical protein